MKKSINFENFAVKILISSERKFVDLRYAKQLSKKKQIEQRNKKKFKQLRRGATSNDNDNNNDNDNDNDNDNLLRLPELSTRPSRRPRRSAYSSPPSHPAQLMYTAHYPCNIETEIYYQFVLLMVGNSSQRRLPFFAEEAHNLLSVTVRLNCAEGSLHKQTVVLTI